MSIRGIQVWKELHFRTNLHKVSRHMTNTNIQTHTKQLPYFHTCSHTNHCTRFLLSGVWSHVGPVSESCMLVKVRKMDKRQEKSVREKRNMEVVRIERAEQNREGWARAVCVKCDNEPA